MIARTVTLLLLLVFSLAAAQDTSERSVEELLNEGNFYLANNNCQLAQYVFQRVLAREEAANNIDALIGKGRALVCQGAFDRGIEEYQRALELDPNNAFAYVQLARAYENQYISDSERYPNRLVDALEALQTAERLDPNSARVFNTKGVVLYQSGDYEGARTAFERAISLASASEFSPADLGAMQVSLGKSYRQLGESDLALTAFKRAVTLDPTSADAHNNLGSTYAERGECEDALYELSQAVSLAPNSLSPVANLAITQFECGQVEASVQRLQQAININGLALPPLYTYLARAYLQQGRVDEAVLEAQKGALLPPVTAEALYWLGQAYVQRGAAGDAELARQAFDRALEINPDFAPAREALAALP